jgi:histidine triad (HIT) family protein
MSLTDSYDRDNIFARILRGEVACYRIYEDDHTLAFLDLFPQSRGHTLVIPKHAAARNILDIAADDLKHLIVSTQRVARAVVAALQPGGVQIFQLSGTAGGQTVFHIHFHVIPRWPGEPFALHGRQRAADHDLSEMASLISAHVGAVQGGG